ncbi:glycosyltransferase [Bacillus timonensis]|nr:glycosyltransferase [Bacillus timonensis]
MKLLFLTNIPSPYMVNFFNELGKLCKLTVLFEKHSSSERDNSWTEFNFNNFEGIIMKGISTGVDSSFCPQVINYIKKNTYDYIIVTNPATPTGIIAIEYMRLRKIPYILESEGSFAKDGKGIKEKFKKHIMSGAQLYLSTTPKADEYFLTYGATKEKIVKYPFTSLYDKDLMIKIPSQTEKEELRQRLRLKGEKIAIAVGRFIPLKYYDVLISAWRQMNKDYQLYLIGDGQEQQNYEKLIEKYNLLNVELIDFKSKEELFNYYKAADIFIHPTSTDVWGLVINEAMACGLPIVTTEMCIAGLELVNDYENGFIVPVGNEKQLVDKVNLILNNDKLRYTMAKKSLEKIKWYTFENMARRHIEILKRT